MALISCIEKRGGHQFLKMWQFFYTGLVPSLNLQVHTEYVGMIFFNSNKNSLKPLCSLAATEQKFKDFFLLTVTPNSELHKLEDT